MLPLQQDLQAGAIPSSDAGDPASMLASRVLASRVPLSSSIPMGPISPQVSVGPGPISPAMASIGPSGLGHQWQPGAHYTGSPATSTPTLSADTNLPVFFPSTFDPPNQNSPHHQQQQTLQHHQGFANHGGGGSGLSLNMTVVPEQGDPGSAGPGSGPGPSGLMPGVGGGEGAYAAAPDGLAIASSSHAILRGVLPGSLDELCPVCNDKVSGYHYGARLVFVMIILSYRLFSCRCLALSLNTR